MSETYAEQRSHVLHKSQLSMVNGAITVNQRSLDAGRSARVLEQGYWGFAAAPDSHPASEVLVQAQRNARAMARFGAAAAQAPLPSVAYRGEHGFQSGKAALSSAEQIERLRQLHAWCEQQFPQLRSVRFMLQEEAHTKHISNSLGADARVRIQRAVCYAIFVAEGDDGKPVELWGRYAAKGGLADLAWDVDSLAPQLHQLHQHLQAKRHAVPAIGGEHAVVMGPALAGILAHEAMGHPCEGDIVLGGAVTGGLLGQAVASPLVTMVDYAHHAFGEEAMMPVYADDEGCPAQDAVLIQDGILQGFMHSRETAARLGHAPTGSARAYAPGDEPLVRMRNTIIHPGQRKLHEIVAEVDEGYLLLETSNGQADTTTEFMFGISLGYEIKGGRIGRAIRDTTLSGNAIKVLKTVDAVSDDYAVNSAGYCGKKQTMVVSMGGPALRARAQLGGA
jgi:TldD protein